MFKTNVYKFTVVDIIYNKLEAKFGLFCNDFGNKSERSQAYINGQKMNDLIRKAHHMANPSFTVK